MSLLPLTAAVIMAALHFFAGRLRFLDVIPRSRWLSVAGGISVAYVVVHLLPELAEYQESIGEATSPLLASFERHLYILALVGLAAFYGVEAWARRSRQESENGAERAATAFSLSTYAVYNALIGYLLARREGALLLFAFAMGVHFIVNDHGLRQNHASAYHRWGRWLLAAAVVAGALVGMAGEVPEAAVGIPLGFTAGGTVLNVLKEELPEERQSRFSAFALGAAGYTVLLLAL